jgi:hypothetical protein
MLTPPTRLELEKVSKAYRKMLLESIYDDDCKSDTYNILAEFKDDHERGINRRTWNLIPSRQYAYAIDKFSKSEPETFMFSDRLLNDWLNIIITNTQEIESISNLTGRNALNGADIVDYYAVQEIFPDEWEESLKNLSAKGYREMGKELGDSSWFYQQVAYDVLNKLGFYEWAVLPDGGTADSDNGVIGVQEILEEIDFDSSPADKLVAINRCLDVFHRRSDWASAFIEGGKRTLYSISHGTFDKMTN